MGLREELDRIMALQAVSTEISREEKDKRTLNLDVEEQRRTIADIEARLAKAHESRVDAQKLADELELKVRRAEGEIVKLDTQLNVTKRQDDYDVIKKSILSHRADISHWEDAAIEHLQKVEDAHAEEEKLKAELDTEKARLQLIEDQVRERSAEHDRRIADLRRQLGEAREQIDEKLLAEYERLTRSRGDTALVQVRKRVCQECHSLVTKQTENLLMRDNELVTCPSCGRLLMLDAS